ncbi:protein KBP homolog [Pseudomyrmex gracilis]|uniref:protein KBP homolog n=1 Tax=Pseudomyrmex gracilis TaxID=219809 RepID=UPI000994BAB0|nr:protein KBP homolog [Pseudomyrmex gracilis]
MHEFLKILSKILAEKRSKSLNAASAENKKPDNSKESLSLKLDVNDSYMGLAQILYTIRLAYVNCTSPDEEPFYDKKKISENHRKILKSKEIQLQKVFKETSNNLANIHFDIVISIAASYTFLGDILVFSNCDLLTSAEECFKTAIELLKGKELDSKAILTALHAYHMLSHEFYTNTKSDESYALLVTAVSLYTTYTKEENYSIPETFIDIFNLEDIRYLKFETDAKEILDNSHVSNLRTLIKLYNMSPKDKHEFVLYMHKLLKDHMEEALVQSGHIEWAIACASLATYFIYYNRFTEAKSHLLIANKVLAEYNDKACMHATEQDNVSLTSMSTETSETKQKVSLFRYADDKLKLQWGLYGISLLRVSKKRLLAPEQNNTPCERDNLNSESLLLFDEKLESLVYLDANKQFLDFTDHYVENITDAFEVFIHNYKNLHKVMARCKENNELHRSVEASLYMSRLCKYISYFESDISKKVQWYNKQIKCLESVIENLNETNNQNVMRMRKILWLEMSVAYTTVMNMSEEILAQTNEDIVEKTIGLSLCALPDKIFDCLTEFYNITLDNEDKKDKNAHKVVEKK